MKTKKFDFENIPQLSQIDKAYARQDPALRPFYAYTPDTEGLAEAAHARKFSTEYRIALVNSLQKQYQQIKTSEVTRQNIEKLALDNSLTITTGHQPSLFTGPLYFIYKIISTINLAEQLNGEHKNLNFVPVYWMGAEDHDFEEVNHCYLFGKTVSWESKQGGSVGHYDLTGIEAVVEEVGQILGNSENAQAIFKILKESYLGAANYGLATARFVNALFGEYGLVILDANRSDLKCLFRATMRDELLHQSSKPIVEKTVEELVAAGFRGQAHARDINLFYLEKNKRSRIVKEGNTYNVLNSISKFDEKGILHELDIEPQNFSPNVILRPLYQETILPNIAYIGGGGELAYWLERKAQFEHFKIPFPVLLRRNSALWIDKGQAKQIENLGFEVERMFDDTENLIKQFIAENSENELSLKAERQKFEQVFTEVINKTKLVDSSLTPSILAQQQQLFKSLDKLEKRLVKAEKQKNETAVQRIRKLKAKLFPSGLQERQDNFLSFYLRYGQSFIKTLKTELKPLDKRFSVLVEQ